ncbi:hypothetical protein HDU91_005887 [Kappamyces sp. JEL0680]|nr:hypothetical protein HDU91_005887 [Kappamyces sp. JEL0680]
MESYLESCDLYFVRSSEHLIMEEIDQKVSSFIAQLDQSDAANSPSPKPIKANLVVSFYEKKVKKHWFGKDDDSPWEEWVVTLDITRARSERDQISAKSQLAKSVEGALAYISIESGRKRDHIPPIVNSEPFPYSISFTILSESSGWTANPLSYLGNLTGNLLPSSQ